MFQPVFVINLRKKKEEKNKQRNNIDIRKLFTRRTFNKFVQLLSRLIVSRSNHKYSFFFFVILCIHAKDFDVKALLLLFEIVKGSYLTHCRYVTVKYLNRIKP